MGSGVNRMMTGAVTGTGSALNVRTVGFRPRVVELLNVGGNVTAKWVEGMADASAVKYITDGTQSLITSDGITPLSDGFTIGADTDINVDTELVRWIAHE